MYWIINDNIEFRPDSKKLISVTNPEINVVLTTPASRCLLLLLNASPDVVTQQEFFKKVWEDEGMLVPANTLYQNISIVRRGLRAVGETDRILVATVPRKGFQIDKSVKISRVAAVQEADVAPDSLQGEDELDGVPHRGGSGAYARRNSTTCPYGDGTSEQQIAALRGHPRHGSGIFHWRYQHKRFLAL